MMKLILIASMFLLTACSTLKSTDCNYDYGYSHGVNAAQAGLQMNTNLDRESVCSDEGKKALSLGYREGFSLVLKSRPSTTNITVNNDSSSSRTRIKKECLEAYGTRVCGYKCQSGYGKVKCASRPDMDCLAAYGDIQCGHNCIAQYGQITCEK